MNSYIADATDIRAVGTVVFFNGKKEIMGNLLKVKFPRIKQPVDFQFQLEEWNNLKILGSFTV